MSSLALLNAFDARLRRLPRPLLLILGLAGLALLTTLDTLGGHRVTLEPFYVVPVLLVAWLSDSRSYGVVMALCATLVQPVEALLFRSSPPGAPPPPSWIWTDAVAQLLLYVLLLWLLTAMRHTLKLRETEARGDALTGIANGRAFRLVAEAELERSRRYHHQLSLLYVDIDDFKAVNDRHGHAEGDRLLCRLAAIISANLRTVDTAARIGGDEFAVLMPETGSRAAGQLAQRLMSSLADEVAGDGQRPTCSLGLVTFRLPPTSVESMLAAGDRLMYEAKAAGKNRLCREVVPIVRTARGQPVRRA